MSLQSVVGPSGTTRANAAGAVKTRERSGQQQFRQLRRRPEVQVSKAGLAAASTGQPSFSSIPDNVRQLPLRAGSGATRPPLAAVSPAHPGSRPKAARSGADPRRSGADPRRSGTEPPAPLRLTRRGRIVLSGLVVSVLTVAALLLSLLASGGAQATNHGQPGAGYQGMRQIVVEPGQTLWSIASVAEPSADTRVVVEEIISANSLGGSGIHVGQLLWVPR